MRNVLFGASLLVAGLLAGQPAGAVMATSPGVQLPSSVTRVDGGCGPGLYRAMNGFCYRKPGWGAVPPPPPPPPYYARPMCAPGFHPTPYGCRPNW